MIGRRQAVRGLRRDTSGLAVVEFALILPIVLLFFLTGAELINYITTRMRVSQMALHLADNAARIGSGSQLAAKTITEADINDLLTGTAMQSGELDIYTRGRVVISSLEPVASPNTAKRYNIRWQRCRGLKNYTRRFGTAGQASGINIVGMGPTGRQVTAPDNGGTMFVEVSYSYQPLIQTSLSPPSDINETASMMIRDRRDMSDDSATTNLHPNGVYKVNGVTASTC